MDNITVDCINPAGIGFTTDSKYEKNKTYNLTLKAVLLHKTVDLNLKIAIIGIEKSDSGNYSCRAVHRNLSDTQVAILKEIEGYFISSNLLFATIE